MLTNILKCEESPEDGKSESPKDDFAVAVDGDAWQHEMAFIYNMGRADGSLRDKKRA